MADVAPNFPAVPVIGSNLALFSSAWGSAWDPATAKLNVDYAVASGCNVMRFLLEVEEIYTGALTLATYFAHIDTVCAYAKSLGLYVYPCLMAPQLTPFTTTEASWRDTTKKVVQHMEAQSYQDIIFAYDLCNEPKNYLSAAQIALIYSDCKGFSSRAMTVAFVAGDGAVTTTQVDGDDAVLHFSTRHVDAGSNSYIAYCDFADIHLYYQTPSATALQPVNASYPAKKLVIGEWGIPASYTPTQRTNQANAIVAAVAGATCMGHMVWNVLDYATVTSNMYGVLTRPTASYNSTGVASLLVPFRKSRGGTSGVSAPTNITVDNSTGLVMWTPMPSTDYVADRLLINGTQVFDDGFALYLAPTIRDRQVRLQASVRNSSTSAITDMIWPGRLPRSLLRRRCAPTFH